MKFAKRLASEASRHQRFSAGYFSYREAKGAIKEDILARDVAGSKFQRLLEAELRKVSLFYSDKADRIEATLQALCAANAAVSVEQLAQLRAEIKELIKFVALNYLAVVKAIKKRNRHLREAFGAAASASLQALDLLGHEVFFASPRLAGLATQADVLVSGLATTSQQPADVLDEYQCAICLDTLHNPVVLTCAHRFCWGCLVAHVTALREQALPLPAPGGDAKASADASSPLRLLERIAAAEESAEAGARFYSCPVCRKPQLLDVDSLSVDPFLSTFIEALKLLSVSATAPAAPPAAAAAAAAPAAAAASSSAAPSAAACAQPGGAPASPLSPPPLATPAAALPATSAAPAAAAPAAPAAAEPYWGLIPPQRPQHAGRLCVLLDLDGTLVSSYTPRRAPRLPPYVRTHVVGVGSRLNPAGVFVVERPGLRAFLEELAAVAEVVVFTAGLEDYAAPIIDAIDPRGDLFAHRIYREGTLRSEHYQCVKDMARLGRDLARTVLVDDTPLAFLHQPDNGVPVLGFRGDPDDRLLLEAVLPLMQVLSKEADVRTVLRRRFDMTTWFRRNSFPIDDIVEDAARAARRERAAQLGARAASASPTGGLSRSASAAAVPGDAADAAAAAAASAAAAAAAASAPRYAFRSPRAAAPTKRFALVADFDCTLVEFDVGQRLVEHVAPELLPMLVGLDPRDSAIPITNSILSEAQRRGVSRDALLSTLQRLGAEGVPLASAELLRMMAGAGVDVHVLSDANSVFVGHVLAGAKVASYVTNVVANAAAFERAPDAGPGGAGAGAAGSSSSGGSGPSGAGAAQHGSGALQRAAGQRLVVRPHWTGADASVVLPPCAASASAPDGCCSRGCCGGSGGAAGAAAPRPHGCPRCPSNLCKGLEVQRLIHSNSYAHVVYCGDGHDDICAALALRPKDVLLARAGHPLARYIAESQGNRALPQVAAQVGLWSTQEELLVWVRQVTDV